MVTFVCESTPKHSMMSSCVNIFKLSTLDDVLVEMKGAHIISKLDIKEAYWHVSLDHESSLITTMITPVGRFRWLRLPFGLKVSHKIFQRKLGEALEGLQNTINVVDNIVLAGCGKTNEEAKTNLDLRNKALKERCTQKGIILNNTRLFQQRRR